LKKKDPSRRQKLSRDEETIKKNKKKKEKRKVR